jgi:cellulose synthase/poly-beta-1,6-N-acetylglucosamine synthase-like glycosyltransferase
METGYYLKLGKYEDLTDKKERIIYRLFEIMPGFLSWATLALVFYLSFTQPVAIALFIIVFDIYWLIRVVYMTLHFRAAFARVRKNMKTDWLKKMQQLAPDKYGLSSVKSWNGIIHLIILPTHKEGAEVIGAAIDGLVKANYPKDKMVVILSQEERAGDGFNEEVSRLIISRFQNQFLKLVAVRHPANIVGELAGKGANIAWAGRYAKEEIIDKMGIPYDHVITSVFDIDTVIFPEYFGRLTYAYLTARDPLHASYQPVPFYTNNIWEAPSFARVVAFSSTFWYMILQERLEASTTFSSHSTPFQALVDVGFWQTNMVSEDSRIFLQCFLRYNGNYRVESLFYPVAMDANVAPTFLKTMANVYKQQRRWAWGAENMPYLLFGFYKNKAIPRFKKFFLFFTQLESFWSWATNALIIFLLGWLPVAFGGTQFNLTVLSFNLPAFTSIILTLATVGLATTAVFSVMILPPRPPKYGKFNHVWMLLQWILFPITTVVLGALPALDAQTRLMLGKYMGFWITPKSRGK